ncbi:hypothetical protein QLQ12_27105 [Actinoplanes sp. NEAU-A12]|uniref:Uncharacterized protein n=1 Tax=Actinoplanes sandaracinus TaxID=3045177 RepID=A0ABT6WRC2_9ACTN|nr:hypothetical protein [Actinoplanes sandaracinus]MDI6102292.1 hypothetical protein [Actinoplanes sandaracinus]
MGETHTPQEPKKIHGDKLAEAFREQDDEVAELPRHPSSEQKQSSWATGGKRADIQRS